MSIRNIPEREHGVGSLFLELLWLLLVLWVNFRVLVLTLKWFGSAATSPKLSPSFLFSLLPIKEKEGKSGQGVVCHNPFVLKFTFYSLWHRLKMVEKVFPGLVAWEPLLKTARVASCQGRLHVPACFPNQDSTPTYLPFPTLSSMLLSTNP